MSQIAYDPIKDRFAAIIRRSRLLRRVFYAILDMVFLRSWNVRRALRAELGDRPNLRILDAGCGFGQYDRFLLARWPTSMVDAIDVKDDYLDDCRHYFDKEIRSGRITFTKSDLTTDTYPAVYDAVLCVDVLEHIHDDVAVMRSLCEALKPGGFLLMHSPSFRAEADADGDGFFVGEHARAGYSIEELDAKFRKAGFTRTDIRYMSGALSHAAWTLLIRWPMEWLTRHFGFALVLPIWYAAVLGPALVMMRIDHGREQPAGLGILGIGFR